MSAPKSFRDGVGQFCALAIPLLVFVVLKAAVWDGEPWTVWLPLLGLEPILVGAMLWASKGGDA